MGVVGLAGDWHGNLDVARWSLRWLRDQGVSRVYHLGDFGIWPGRNGEYYLEQITRAAKALSIELWVTPGNHEDYDQIAGITASEDGLQWFTSHVALIPRNHRWDHEGRSFVSLGGAPSIDFEQRREGISWWRKEMLTEAEAFRCAEDGYADVMLAHDAPDNGTNAVQDILDNPGGWSPKGLAYAAEGRKLMNIAVEGVRPRVFAHGHYHVADDTQRAETRFLALAGDGMPGNIALLRLDDLAVSWDGSTWTTDPSGRTETGGVE